MFEQKGSHLGRSYAGRQVQRRQTVAIHPFDFGPLPNEHLRCGGSIVDRGGDAAEVDWVRGRRKCLRCGGFDLPASTLEGNEFTSRG